MLTDWGLTALSAQIRPHNRVRLRHETITIIAFTSYSMT